jgi:signal transduction histidine kinase
LLRRDLGDDVTVDKQYGEIPKILCYPGELNQVFLNLIGNAIQSIESEGVVTIETSAGTARFSCVFPTRGREFQAKTSPVFLIRAL